MSYFTIQIDPATAFAIREAKRSKKPKRLRAVMEDAPEPKRKKSIIYTLTKMNWLSYILEAKKQQSVINMFERELTDTSKKTLRTFR